MNINDDLVGKVIKLVDADRLAIMANGGETLPADALEMLSELRVKRVTDDGLVVGLPLCDEDKAVYDPVADSWDIEVPLLNTEVELCYEVVA
jgi:hypothetical protein